tara:strand:+ start:21 stop:1100 length:1080 start_codon:yes stop_codon:yes gene_type:complete
MSFVAKTKSPVEWKLISEVSSAIVEEPSFEANAEGIQFRGMDPSHVAMIDLNWPNASFEKYECDKEYKFTVRGDELSKLMKRTNQSDSMSISIEDEDYMIVRLEDEAKVKGGRKRKFEIRLIESSQSTQQVPKLSLDSKIVINKKLFEETLKDIGAVSDHVIFETNQIDEIDSDKTRSYEINVIGKADSGKAEVVLNKSNEGVMEISAKSSNPIESTEHYINEVKEHKVHEEKKVEELLCSKCGMAEVYLQITDTGIGDGPYEPDKNMIQVKEIRSYRCGKSECKHEWKEYVSQLSKATYSLSYLVQILKAVGTSRAVFVSSENITMEYSWKMPFKIEFKLGDAGGKFNFYLAPRIDDR